MPYSLRRMSASAKATISFSPLTGGVHIDNNNANEQTFLMSIGSCIASDFTTYGNKGTARLRDDQNKHGLLVERAGLVYCTSPRMP